MRAPVGDRRLKIAGLLLLAGAAITLSLHAAGAPEALLGFLYDKLLSGLDAPPDPSQGARDAVAYTSLVGGLAQLAAGLVVLALWLSRRARPAGSPAAPEGGPRRRSRSTRSSRPSPSPR